MSESEDTAVAQAAALVATAAPAATAAPVSLNLDTLPTIDEHTKCEG